MQPSILPFDHGADRSVFVDTHFHIWDLKKFAYLYPSPDFPIINRDFLIKDYLNEVLETPIMHSIFVQAASEFPVEEAEWLLSSSKKHSHIAGMVAGFKLDDPNLEQILNRFGKEKLFVGIRNILAFREDNWILSDDALRGFSHLVERKIPYHILINTIKTRNCILTLLKQNPIHPYVVDHMGKPVVGSEVQHGWDEWITEVSKYPNVYCKLSSQFFPTQSRLTDAQQHGDFSSEDRKYVNRCLELFGVDRCMFGSDFPVNKCGGLSSVKDSYNIVNGMLNHLTQEERNKIFGSNSTKFYGLDI